jgi:hypothetical protein
MTLTLLQNYLRFKMAAAKLLIDQNFTMIETLSQNVVALRWWEQFCKIITSKNDSKRIIKWPQLKMVVILL